MAKEAFAEAIAKGIAWHLAALARILDRLDLTLQRLEWVMSYVDEESAERVQRFYDLTELSDRLRYCARVCENLAREIDEMVGKRREKG